MPVPNQGRCHGNGPRDAGDALEAVLAADDLVVTRIAPEPVALHHAEPRGGDLTAGTDDGLEEGADGRTRPAFSVDDEAAAARVDPRAAPVPVVEMRGR